MPEILRASQFWECPNCTATHVTHEPRPHLPFHKCPGLYGLESPYIPAGRPGKIEAIEREDYVGNELVQVDGRGRPIAAVRATQDDHDDVAVFAPVARAGGGSMMGGARAGGKAYPPRIRIGQKETR